MDRCVGIAVLLSPGGLDELLGRPDHRPPTVAFDGINVWVANNAADTVTRLRASDGANVGTFAAGDGPVGVAFDGANIWVTNETAGASPSSEPATE